MSVLAVIPNGVSHYHWQRTLASPGPNPCRAHCLVIVSSVPAFVCPVPPCTDESGPCQSGSAYSVQRPNYHVDEIECLDDLGGLFEFVRKESGVELQNPPQTGMRPRKESIKFNQFEKKTKGRHKILG